MQKSKLRLRDHAEGDGRGRAIREGEPRVNPLKAARRREARAARSALPAAWRAEASTQVMRRVLELPEIRAARLVALYASIGAELDTRGLIAELIRLKGAVALPRARRNPWRLDFHRVAEFPKDFLRGVRGIHEPDPAHCGPRLATGELDLILVPGLLFDRRGYRIGYGGGYYDWLLAEPGRPRAIGLAFSAQLVSPDQPLPLDPWDQPVDSIVTERELIVVARRANG